MRDKESEQFTGFDNRVTGFAFILPLFAVFDPSAPFTLLRVSFVVHPVLVLPFFDEWITMRTDDVYFCHRCFLFPAIVCRGVLLMYL
jgi:hypothetical protein